MRLFCSDQMQLSGLIILSLIMVLVHNSKGIGWTVDVNRTFTVTLGSSLTIPCKFTHPGKSSDNVKVFWKTPGRGVCVENQSETNAFVFHSNKTCVIEKYRGKTKLIGNAVEGNCTLRIQNITAFENNIYVRVSANGKNFSFLEEFVSISVTGVTSNTTETNVTKAIMYTAIIVPVAALLIIALVAGIFFSIKRKRSESFTREESGYYANFSRASSNSPKRGEFFKEDKKPPEPKVIEEPVYINVEASRGQMDQRMEDADNIYANMDYSK